MASSMKTSQHNRSHSVPSASHPLISQIEGQLHRLKSSESTSSSSSSSSTNQTLNLLQDMHGCTDKILQMPTTQRALAQECCKTCLHEVLEGSLRMLDICNTSKDALIQSKESIHELQSAARRTRSGGELVLIIEGEKYLSSRKNMKKAIKKALENLKGIIKKASILSSLDIDSASLSIINSIKEAEFVTLNQLESLLYFISGSTTQQRLKKLSVVSKLMQPKRVACESESSNMNEFEKVDKALQSLLCHKPRDIVSIEEFLNHMQNLELCIEVLEEGIEQLQRQLIRTRVSLLNIPIKQ